VGESINEGFLEEGIYSITKYLKGGLGIDLGYYLALVVRSDPWKVLYYRV
jgi:hypothetical protein